MPACRDQRREDNRAGCSTRAAGEREIATRGFKAGARRADALDTPKRFVDELDRLIVGRSAALAIRRHDQVTKIAVAASGGGKAARHDARRKEMAAALAFELWIRFCDGFPEGARLYELADFLFEAATGRAGNCRPACVGFLRAVKRQVPIDKNAWKRVG